MDAHDRLIAKVAAEQDDLLATLSLCGTDAEVAERVWCQLVDLLVEGMFLDLRRDYLDGESPREAYVAQLTGLATACRERGLLPLPVRGR